MIETRIRQAPDAVAAGSGASAAGRSRSGLAVRLWALLHAQALLRGTIGGAGGASCIEDDRRRLAARQESTYRA
jgi:hypothetical protein